jgi:hypothetical protein
MLDRRWLAGFFDGEGCVYLQSMKRVNRQLPRYSLSVFLTQNDKAILEEVQREFGGKVTQHSGRRCYRWRVVSRNVLDFLYAVYPHSILKRDQINLAIEFACSIRTTNIGNVSMGEETNKRRAFIHNRLKELKHSI